MQIAIFILGVVVLVSLICFALGRTLLRADNRRGLNICILLLIPMMSALIYSYVGNFGSVFNTATHQTAAIDDFVARLEEKLQSNPNDTKTLKLAGKAYRALGKYEKAGAVYKKLNGLLGEDAEILSAWAEAEMLAADGVISPAVIKKVNLALAINPNHIHSLWMSVIVAEADGNYAAAVDILQKILGATNDPRQRQAVQDRIAKISRAQGQEQ